MAVSTSVIKTDEQGREITEHGSTLFPAACYAENLAEDMLTWHWHDELEVIIVEEGAVVVAAGAEKFVVKQGDGFFINAGVLHAVWSAGVYREFADFADCYGAAAYIQQDRTRAQQNPMNMRQDTACRIRSVVFHPRLVGGSIDSIFWQNYVQPLLANDFLKCAYLSRDEEWGRDAIEAIAAAWIGGVEEHPGYEISVRYHLSQLLFLLNAHRPTFQHQPSEKAVRDSQRIKAMLQYIQEYYGEELSTGQIAKSAMISESECLRCFRSTIGTTPIQYVKQFRIQKAAQLLEDTELKISDIGMQCGFLEMSYFAKTFRELHGCTPTEFRRQRRVFSAV